MSSNDGMCTEVDVPVTDSVDMPFVSESVTVNTEITEMQPEIEFMEIETQDADEHDISLDMKVENIPNPEPDPEQGRCSTPSDADAVDVDKAIAKTDMPSSSGNQLASALGLQPLVHAVSTSSVPKLNTTSVKKGPKLKTTAVQNVKSLPVPTADLNQQIQGQLVIIPQKTATGKVSYASYIALPNGQKVPVSVEVTPSQIQSSTITKTAPISGGVSTTTASSSANTGSLPKMKSMLQQPQKVVPSLSGNVIAAGVGGINAKPTNVQKKFIQEKGAVSSPILLGCAMTVPLGAISPSLDANQTLDTTRHSGVKTCVFCGPEYNGKSFQLHSKIYVESNERERIIDILERFFPEQHREFTSSYYCVICEGCRHSLGRMWRDLKRAEEYREYLCKLMSTVYPNRSKEVLGHEFYDKTFESFFGSDGKQRKPYEAKGPKTREAFTQTNLVLCEPDHEVPRSILMTASSAAKELDKTVRLTPKNVRNPLRSRPCQISVIEPTTFPPYGAPLDRQYIPPKSREVVLIQVPRGPYASLGTQTYMSHMAEKSVDKIQTRRVVVERGTDIDKSTLLAESERDSKVPSKVNGESGCVVCGQSMKNIGFYSVTWDSQLAQFLFKNCGLFFNKEDVRLICTKCRSLAIAYDSGIQQLRARCKEAAEEEAPSVSLLPKQRKLETLGSGGSV